MTRSSARRNGPVLVGVTDDTGSTAVSWAAAEAARRGVPLHLLHAYSSESSYPWGYGYPLPAGVLHSAEEVARNNALSVLEDAANTVRDEHPDVEVLTTLARGSAAASLVSGSADSSLLVVSRRMHKHPRLAALGSVSLAVAAHAACPVIVLPAAGTPQGPTDATGSPWRATGHVVVGVEDSPECLDAAGFAFAHAAARGLPVTVVHAWWVDPAVLAMSEVAAWAELDADEPVVVDAILAPWLGRYPDVRVTRVIAREQPADALLGAAAGAELLVVGSRGRGGFTGLLLGSVSQAVLHHSRCPVAIVHK